MKSPAKTPRRILIAWGVTVLVLGGMSIVPLKHVGEYFYAEDVKGYWATLQEFVEEKGRYPKDEAEIGAYYNVTLEQLKQEPVVYVPPHSTNADEVVLWWKKKTIFGVKVGITESGVIVKKRSLTND